MEKAFKGKIIYEPKGAALEYAPYAANLFTGCAGGCYYCYNKKGITAKVLGAYKPTLRKCFKDESDALKQFNNDLIKNREVLKNNGIFFSFVGDPFCKEAFPLIFKCIYLCNDYYIPVTILTKQTCKLSEFIDLVDSYELDKKIISIGFTLTGHDEQEPGCVSNMERINAIKILRDRSFKTWCSIEPVITFKNSFNMICETNGYCDAYKIGLQSGKKYNKNEVVEFVEAVKRQNEFYNSKLIFKESIKKYL